MMTYSNAPHCSPVSPSGSDQWTFTVMSALSSRRGQLKGSPAAWPMSQQKPTVSLNGTVALACMLS